MADYRILKNNIDIEVDASGNLKNPKNYYLGNLGKNSDNTKHRLMNNPDIGISINMSNNFVSVSATWPNNSGISNPLSINVQENTNSTTREASVSFINSDFVKAVNRLIIKQDAAISYGGMSISLAYDNPLDWDDIENHAPSISIIQNIEDNGESTNITLTSDDIASIKYSVNNTTIATINENTGIVSFKLKNSSYTTNKEVTVTVTVKSKLGDVTGSTTYKITLEKIPVVSTTYELTGNLLYQDMSSAGGNASPSVSLTLERTYKYADNYEATSEISISDYTVLYTYSIKTATGYSTINMNTGVLTWDEMPTDIVDPRFTDVKVDIIVRTNGAIHKLIATKTLETTAKQDKKEIAEYIFDELSGTLVYSTVIPADGGTSSPTFIPILPYKIKYTDGTETDWIDDVFPGSLTTSVVYNYDSQDVVALGGTIDPETGVIEMPGSPTDVEEPVNLNVELTVTITYIGDIERTVELTADCTLEGSGNVEIIYSNLLITLVTYTGIEYDNGTTTNCIIVPCEGLTTKIIPIVDYTYTVETRPENGTGTISPNQTGGASITFTYINHTEGDPRNKCNATTGLLTIYSLPGNVFDTVCIGLLTVTVSIGDAIPDQKDILVYQYGHSIESIFYGPIFNTFVYNNNNPLDATITELLLLNPDIICTYTQIVNKICSESYEELSNDTYINYINPEKFEIEYSMAGSYGSINKSTGIYTISHTNNLEDEITLATITATVTIKDPSANGLNATTTYIIKLAGKSLDVVTYQYTIPTVRTFEYNTSADITGGTISPALVVELIKRTITNGEETHVDTLLYNSVAELLNSGHLIEIEFKTSATNDIAEVNLDTGDVTFTTNAKNTNPRSISVLLTFNLNGKTFEGTYANAYQKKDEKLPDDGTGSDIGDDENKSGYVYSIPFIPKFIYSDAEGAEGSLSIPTVEWNLTYYYLTVWSSGEIEKSETTDITNKSDAQISYSIVGDEQVGGYSLNKSSGILTWTKNPGTGTRRSAPITIHILSNGKSNTASFQAMLNGYIEKIYRPVFLRIVD